MERERVVGKRTEEEEEEEEGKYHDFFLSSTRSILNNSLPAYSTRLDSFSSLSLQHPYSLAHESHKEG